ncbi:hypothetical protein BEH_07520 [Priestia filamentosa]|uniref:Uncharacterized protein n=1 Tax=Priestia filamentosa TaxID=1402861 RepID=A0A0H4KEB4_9BACI|nr:hypothetical protein [Priestia filamentosa]AKO91960.1 hypothetical protein BEH_07520 [Priestia filamentosa]
MNVKREGFALVTLEGEYLTFEQVAERDIEVYAVENADEADLFNTEMEANEIALDILKERSQWNYLLESTNNPVSIVKVIKELKIEKTKEL